MYCNSNITLQTLQIKKPGPKPEADAYRGIAKRAENIVRHT
jgi:hypothetical protein